jgi:hypothetical protein
MPLIRSATMSLVIEAPPTTKKLLFRSWRFDYFQPREYFIGIPESAVSREPVGIITAAIAGYFPVS